MQVVAGAYSERMEDGTTTKNKFLVDSDLSTSNIRERIKLLKENTYDFDAHTGMVRRYERKQEEPVWTAFSFKNSFFYIIDFLSSMIQWTINVVAGVLPSTSLGEGNWDSYSEHEPKAGLEGCLQDTINNLRLSFRDSMTHRMWAEANCQHVKVRGCSYLSTGVKVEPFHNLSLLNFQSIGCCWSICG